MAARAPLFVPATSPFVFWMPVKPLFIRAMLAKPKQSAAVFAAVAVEAHRIPQAPPIDTLKTSTLPASNNDAAPNRITEIILAMSSLLQQLLSSPVSGISSDGSRSRGRSVAPQ